MATYTHTNKNTRHLGLDLSHIYQQRTLKYANTCGQIQIYTLSDSHTPIHTNMHTHSDTLEGIYQETQRSASGPLGDPGS